MVEISGRNTRLEMIGSAAAGIAHDINNQLMLILNHLDGPNVQVARDAARRCCALTASLLCYCRGETLEFQAIGVAAFLRSFVEGLHLPAGVCCTIEIDEPMGDIKADPLAITRVLMNLVNNACDAMQNQGSLWIRAAGAIIEISDSGPGIAAADLNQIFEPFFSTKGSSGTGLGLPIVREIMRQHGGSVAVRSEPGKGATFTLRFRSPAP